METKQKDVLKELLSIPLDELIDTGIKPIPIIQDVHKRLTEGFVESSVLYFKELNGKEIFESTLKKGALKPITLTESKEAITIAGGCLSDYFVAEKLGEEYSFKDIDVFMSGEFNAFIGVFNDESNKSDKIQRMQSFLERAFPDADKIENKFTDINDKYDFVTMRFIFGIEWKGVHIEVIFNNLEVLFSESSNDFDISFRKFYYRGDNILTYKSSLQAIEKKEINLMNLSSPKNTFLRVDKFESRFGFTLDRYSKILLYIAIEQMILEEELSESGYAEFASPPPPRTIFGNSLLKEFEEPTQKKFKLEDRLLKALEKFTQNFKEYRRENYRLLFIQCQNEFLSSPKQREFFTNFEEIKKSLVTGRFRKRVIHSFDKEITINDIVVPFEEFDNDEIYTSNTIFKPIGKEVILNSLEKIKRKKQLKDLYNSEKKSNSSLLSQQDFEGAFPHLIDGYDTYSEYLPDIINRIASDDIHRDFPLSKKQNAKILFNQINFAKLVTGTFATLTIGYEFSHGVKYLSLKWLEEEKCFEICSHSSFLFLDSNRIKAISDAFELELGFPAHWRQV